MIPKRSFPLACLAVTAFALIFLQADPLGAQSPLAPKHALADGALPSPPSTPRQLPAEATAVIRAGLAQPVIVKNNDGSFERVGLKRSQMVDITVQYPAAKAGRRIMAMPLDGGRVIAPVSLVVAGDGVIRFKFQAGNQAGAYQVALHDGAQELGLHFWVLDEQHPEKNPVVVDLKN